MNSYPWPFSRALSFQAFLSFRRPSSVFRIQNSLHRLDWRLSIWDSPPPHSIPREFFWSLSFAWRKSSSASGSLWFLGKGQDIENSLSGSPTTLRRSGSSQPNCSKKQAIRLEFGQHPDHPSHAVGGGLMLSPFHHLVATFPGILHRLFRVQTIGKFWFLDILQKGMSFWCISQELSKVHHKFSTYMIKFITFSVFKTQTVVFLGFGSNSLTTSKNILVILELLLGATHVQCMSSHGNSFIILSDFPSYWAPHKNLTSDLTLRFWVLKNTLQVTCCTGFSKAKKNLKHVPIDCVTSGLALRFCVLKFTLQATCCKLHVRIDCRL